MGMGVVPMLRVNNALSGDSSGRAFLCPSRPGDTAAAGGGYALVLRLRITFRIFDFVRIPMGYSSIVCRCFLWFHAVSGRMLFPDEAFSLLLCFYSSVNQCSADSFCPFRASRPVALRKSGAYSAESTRVLAAEYSSVVRQVLSAAPHGAVPDWARPCARLLSSSFFRGLNFIQNGFA